MVKSDKIKTRVLVSLLMASVFSLTGCGGSSGGGGGTAASPNGIYTGSITGGQGANGFNGGEKAAIYNGKMMLFSAPGDIRQIFELPFTVNGKNISGSMNIYDNSNNIKGISTTSGSFEPGQLTTISFTSALNGNGGPTSISAGKITLNAQTTGFNQGASLNLLTNSGWNGFHGSGPDETNISFDANGDITGNSNGGCVFIGTTTIPDSNKNLYIVSITTTNTSNCTTLPSSTYTGFAWFDEGDNNTLNFAVADGARSRAIVLNRQ